MSSLEWGDHMREVTWEFVSSELDRAPVVVIQKWMCLSADPPPVASKFCCHGHQARAFTAAVWLRFVHLGAHRGTTPGWSSSTDWPTRALGMSGLLHE
jgi:hypothetical protein